MKIQFFPFCLLLVVSFSGYSTRWLFLFILLYSVSTELFRFNFVLRVWLKKESKPPSKEFLIGICFLNSFTSVGLIGFDLSSKFCHLNLCSVSPKGYADWLSSKRKLSYAVRMKCLLLRLRFDLPLSFFLFVDCWDSLLYVWCTFGSSLRSIRE